MNVEQIQSPNDQYYDKYNNQHNNILKKINSHNIKLLIELMKKQNINIIEEIIETEIASNYNYDEQLKNANDIYNNAINKITTKQITSNKNCDIDYVNNKYNKFIESKNNLNSKTYKFIINKYYTLTTSKIETDIKNNLLDELKNIIKKHNENIQYVNFCENINNFIN